MNKIYPHIGAVRELDDSLNRVAEVRISWGSGQIQV